MSLNVFLAIRTTLFALMLMFSFLVLGFAAWNISVTSTIGHNVAGASIFMILNSCLVFLFIASASIEIFKPHIRSTNVLVECLWVVLVALFQLGAAIGTTINGASLSCRITGDWSICASTNVLVPVSWISTFISFTYFFVLFVTVVTHANTYPNIWAHTIFTIDWFVDPRIMAFSQHTSSQPRRLVSWSGYLDGIKSSAGRKQLYALEDDRDLEKAPWAANLSVRRGKDDPYASTVLTRSNTTKSGKTTPYSSSYGSTRKTPTSSNSHLKSSSGTLPYLTLSHQSTPATENASLPSIPPSIASRTRSSFGARFSQRLAHDLRLLTEPALPEIRTVSPFPSQIENYDMPIPIPHKSQWIRADGKF